MNELVYFCAFSCSLTFASILLLCYAIQIIKLKQISLEFTYYTGKLVAYMVIDEVDRKV